MNTKVGSPVPSIIWDAFTDVMEANTLRLAKEISQALGVSHLPLMNAIKARKSQPYIVEFANDERDIDMRCDYVCQNGRLIEVCAQPVLWRPAEICKRCPQHLYSKPLPYKPLPAVEKLVDSPLYISEDGTIYDSEFEPRGHRYSSLEKTLMFEVE